MSRRARAAAPPGTGLPSRRQAGTAAGARASAVVKAPEWRFFDPRGADPGAVAPPAVPAQGPGPGLPARAAPDADGLASGAARVVRGALRAEGGKVFRRRSCRTRTAAAVSGLRNPQINL
ncbi:hypothetical protein GCM10010129_26800 [Streptomyces fumigatiscleroticus]|nr:hypothetical protein GCM10010129_26800 [Streptomyces fumigatiscleroticus]